MPIDDTILGREKDGTLNEKYCKWCYADGTYTYNDMDDLIEVCVKNKIHICNNAETPIAAVFTFKLIADRDFILICKIGRAHV